ncbi:CDP-glycerol glycerophosphotransferase family protein [Bacillus massiliglaciei]|uniref:CDP-glycerol glycerophosphotransferase family protein n=1 Tax=Bacillus massiliglaciei TaxID=1816693 RepID=UPI000AEC0232|nr:CDP-glycerol glycerophosphotransferase family protein [Bacillus massiliglaciei]
MRHNLSFGSFENSKALLNEGYTVFNGTRSLIKNKKDNMKYYIYSKETGEKIIFDEYEPMTILQTLVLEDSFVTKEGKRKNERIVFFVDTKCRLSFVKTHQDNMKLSRILDKVEKTPFYRSIVFLLFFHFLFFGVMRVRNQTFNSAYLSLGYDKALNYKLHFLFPKWIREKYALRTNKLALLVHAYWAWIPMKDIYAYYLETSNINIPVFIKLSQDDYSLWYFLRSDSRHVYSRNHYIWNTRSFRLRKNNSELFIRKSITGQYVIVVTNIMSKSIVLKEKLAKLYVNLFVSNKEKYDVYFEKFSAGASESAFEVFKYAYTRKDDCVYVLDKDHPEYRVLKQKYGKKLVAKNSFIAFYHIFTAKSFQSSDLVSHIQRRLYDNDSLIKEKILDVDKKVMLQHGVCMCTNIFERGYFNRKVPIAPDYILVNSQFEKSLFTEHTGYTDEEIMVTGLPNLDLYVKEKENQKKEITFMLTWRPWDLTGSIEPGSYLDRYFSFIELVKNNEFYKGIKVNVVLHPKSKLILQEQFPEVFEKYHTYFYEGDIKEALLRSKVLISDYSSVVFYAFAGGTNVILYWEDKELAEQEYGAPNILQKDIAFGDIVGAFDQLHSHIVKNYQNPQSVDHQSKYGQLMECIDGTNTKNTYEYIQNIIMKEEASGKQLDIAKEETLDKRTA